MAREYARVKVGIWADSDFRLLSDSAQALYFRLISSPTMSLCGVADWRPKRLAALTAGMTVERIWEVGFELAQAGYVVIDDETEEVLVRSFVRHDGLIKTPNIAASMVKDFAGVASPRLQGAIVHELHRLRREEPDMSGWVKASVLLDQPSIDPSTIPLPPDPSPKASPDPSPRKGSGMGSPKGSGNGSDILKPSSLNQQPAAHSPEPPASPPGFDDFWAVYPRRDDKGHARTAWARAVRKADVSVIIDGARRLRDDPNLPEKKFIALPATWLNGERWGDEPLPARNGIRSVDRQGDLLRAEAARLDALEAQSLQIGGVS